MILQVHTRVQTASQKIGITVVKSVVAKCTNQNLSSLLSQLSAFHFYCFPLFPLAILVSFSCLVTRLTPRVALTDYKILLLQQVYFQQMAPKSL